MTEQADAATVTGGRAGSRFAAVLFDMDGTLVDSDAAVERSWRTWARRYRVPEESVLAVMAGNPAEATVRAVRPDLTGAELAAATADQLALEYLDTDDVVATPGAHELLGALRLPWAVVTSADERLATIRLRAAGIAPPLLVPRDAVAAGKPDPEGYLLAARLLGVDPGACLVVEDTVVGATAGRVAGATVAGLKGTSGVDHALADLDDVHPLLERA